MPSYGVEEDKVAEQIYQNLGLEVFTAPSNELSGVGLGSIHCITMSYPEL
jgi:arginine deiminase